MNNNVIRSDDPKATEKLTEKLESCQKQQEFMKTVNSYYRKNGTVHGCPGVSDLQANKLDDKVINSRFNTNVPFLSFELSNNNAEIRRLKSRISQLKENKDVGFVGWDFNGGKAVANTSNNRLQLVFEEKPSAEQCNVLKHNGFHWSPKEQAWQRMLNDNAIYAASRIDFIRPESGINPLKLQPKTPKKDVPER